MTKLVIAGMLVVALAVPAMAQKGVFFALGDGMRGCGEFIKSVEAERKERPANARPNAVYNIYYSSFISFADGFLSGANFTDAANSRIGQGTDEDGMMLWLENYCRKNPLATYIGAVIALRKDLATR